MLHLKTNLELQTIFHSEKYYHVTIIYCVHCTPEILYQYCTSEDKLFKVIKYFGCLPLITSFLGANLKLFKFIMQNHRYGK